MKKIVLVILLISFGVATAYSKNKEKTEHPADTLKKYARVLYDDDTNKQLPQVIPPSPQSAMFDKYINHEVSEYNGVPTIEIPLHEISIKGIKIPITLSYHAGGIKYHQYDGDIAAGWSIGAGGYKISRTVNGKPDEMAPMYNETDFDNYVVQKRSGKTGEVGYAVSIGTSSETSEYNSYCKNEHSFRYMDGEYDHFSYMTPGGNGQFIITNRDNRTRTVVNSNPENKVVLRNDATLYLKDMSVIDGNGNTYYMGTLPGDTNVYEEGPKNQDVHATAWPLRRIVTTNKEAVNFDYTMHRISYDRTDLISDDYYAFTVNDAIRDECTYSSGYNTTYANFQFTDPFYHSYGHEYDTYFIDRITAGLETVKFVRYAYDTNLPYVLKEIQVGVGGSLVKHIKFEYTKNTHRLLTKITVNDQVYNFDYYPNNLAHKYSDVWGYYKSSTTSSSWNGYMDQRLKEDNIVYRVGSSYITEKKLKDIPEIQNYIVWVDRETNGATTHAFSLKKITYPTGGTTEYVYEPNQYKDFYQRNQPVITGAGQRIQKIISKPSANEPAVTTLFKYGVNECGYTNMNLINPKSLLQNYITESLSHTTYSETGTGSCYRTSMTRSYSSRKPFNMELDDTPPIVYPEVTRYQFADNKPNGKTIYYYNLGSNLPYAGSSRSTYAGGFNHLSHDYTYIRYLGHKAMPDSISVYDSTNKPVQKQQFIYSSGNGIGNQYQGVRIRLITYIKDFLGLYTAHNRDFDFTVFDYSINKTAIRTRLPATVKNITYHNGAPVTVTENYLHNARNQITKVSQTASDGKVLVKDYKYADSFSGSVYSEMMTKNMIFPVIEEVVTNNNREISRTRISYSNDSNTSNRIQPQKVETSTTGASGLKTALTYDRYDINGNILQYTGADGIKNSFLWSYYNQYLVAHAINLDYDTLRSKAYWSSTHYYYPTANDFYNIEKLNSTLPNVQITTYKYNQFGIMEIVDPYNMRTYYDYDASGRLKEISVRPYLAALTAKKPLQFFFYNYKNK